VKLGKRMSINERSGKDMNEAKREFYLDWVRVLVVALLVPHHAAITFSHIGDAYVLTSIKDSSPYFFIQSTFLNLWFMRALFFISGISTYYALLKRSNQQYLWERVQRLLIPAVFMILFICPVTGYLLALKSYNFHGSLLAFYPEFFKGFDQYLGWGHAWFLVYLFVYSLILLIIRLFFGKEAALTEKFNNFLSKNRNIVFPILLIIFLELLFRPFFPGRQNLYADWANFTIYLTFFLLGYMMASKKECIAAISENKHLFLLIGLISGVLFIFLKYAGQNIPWFISSYNMTYGNKLVMAFLQGIAEYSLVMFCVGAAKKYLNIQNTLLVYLAKTSFALYLFHFVILSLLLFFLAGIAINHFVLYTAVICLTYIVFSLLFELVIKRIPILRYICGIKGIS
jgi:glucan biosynthesis protein C